MIYCHILKKINKRQVFQDDKTPLKCPESLLDHHVINVQIFSNQVMQSFITSKMEITNMSAQKQTPFQAGTSPFL